MHKNWYTINNKESTVGFLLLSFSIQNSHKNLINIFSVSLFYMKFVILLIFILIMFIMTINYHLWFFERPNLFILVVATDTLNID